MLSSFAHLKITEQPKLMNLYLSPTSAPCRSVIVLGKTLNIKFNKILVNIMDGEHMNPPYLKMNPQHTVPTLVDNGFPIWESRAILVYLVEKYAKDDSLYPKNPKAKAVINQRLYFDMGTLYKSFMDYYYPKYRLKVTVDPEQFKAVEDAFDILNTLLQGQQYVANNALTIADYSIYGTVCAFDAVNFQINAYKYVSNWYESFKKDVAGAADHLEFVSDLKNYYGL